MKKVVFLLLILAIVVSCKGVEDQATVSSTVILTVFDEAEAAGAFDRFNAQINQESNIDSLLLALYPELTDSRVLTRKSVSEKSQLIIDKLTHQNGTFFLNGQNVTLETRVVSSTVIQDPISGLWNEVTE